MRTIWTRDASVVRCSLLAGVASISLAACGEASGGAEAPTEAGLRMPLVCGQEHYLDSEGQTQARDVWYRLGPMNRRLDADPALRAAVGLSEVVTCDQAKQFVTREREYLESSSSESVDVTAPPETRAARSETSDKIAGGTAGPWQGVVRIGGCTGTMISNRVIVTAGHCIDPASLFYDSDGDGDVDAGLQWLPVNYDKGAGIVWCLTNTPAAALKPCTSGDVPLTVMLFPNYTNGSDARNDFALIINTVRPWSGTLTNADFKRVNSGGLAEDHDFWAVGQGGSANGGTLFQLTDGRWRQQGIDPFVLRNDRGNIDWLGTGHFIHETGQVRTCAGDSGGPAFETKSESIAGIMSNAEVSGSGSKADPLSACATSSGIQRWSRVSHKLNWINGRLAAYGLPQCVRTHSENGISSKECF